MIAPSPIRVLVADDQALVRGGFSVLLGSSADLEVVGEAADGVQAVAMARELVPDRDVAKRHYPNVVIDNATIDEIMLLYVKGEKV